MCVCRNPLQVQEQKRQLKISKRKQPAARLIQCAWKFYISEQELKRSFRQKFAEPLNIKCRSILWKRFETKQNKQKPIGQNEMYKLHFVFAVQLCIAKRDFVKAFKPYDIKDVLEQYAAGHADMSHKIRIMDHRLEKIQSNSISFKSQNEFRLRFATHLTKLEYEMQKIQMNFNELLQYQLNSRLVIGNLLKFLIDQQISIKNNGCQFGCNGSCAICRRTRAQCAKLSDEFEQIDLASQVNRVFSTYNQNILSHLKASNKGHQVQQRQPSFHRERRNSFWYHHREHAHEITTGSRVLSSNPPSTHWLYSTLFNCKTICVDNEICFGKSLPFFLFEIKADFDNGSWF